MAELKTLTTPLLYGVYAAERGGEVLRAQQMLRRLGLSDLEIKRMVGLLHAFALSGLSPWEKVRGIVSEFVRIEDARVEMEKIRVIAGYLLEKLGYRKPQIVMALGSKLGALADQIEDGVVIPFEQIPCIPRVTHVEGHAGNLVVGRLEEQCVAALQGRFHLYQGVTAMEAVRLLRALIYMGGKQFYVTNAGGAVKPDKFQPGDLMLIRDGWNMTGRNPLVGPNLDKFGPRFPAATKAFAPELLHLVREWAGKEIGLTPEKLKEGTYVQVLGPNYEWDMEVEDLHRRRMIDAVGMSTVIETLSAFHAGVQVTGVTLITNVAAGLSEAIPHHGEVQEVAEQASPQFQALMRLLVRHAPDLYREFLALERVKEMKRKLGCFALCT